MKKLLVILLALPLVFSSFSCKENTPEDGAHTCTFDKRVVTDAYRAVPATCQTPAIYFYSCECGNKSADIFIDGEPLPHSYENDRCIYCHREKPDDFVPPSGDTSSDGSIDLPIVPLNP